MEFVALYNLYPLKFTPIYQERIWGGTQMSEVLKRDVPAGKVLYGRTLQAVAPTWLSIGPMGFCVTEDE